VLVIIQVLKRYGGLYMKRILIYMTCVISVFSILSGCSGTAKSVQPAANSGVVDKEYVGNPNPELKNVYKQTTEEAKAQADLVKAIEEEKASFKGGGLSGH
jgi:hypothetical protein